MDAAVSADHLGGDILPALLNGLPDAGNKHAVAGLVVKGGIPVQREGQDAPVDAIAAVALGGELVADVGEADRKSTRLNSSHNNQSRMPSSA